MCACHGEYPRQGDRHVLSRRCLLRILGANVVTAMGGLYGSGIADRALAAQLDKRRTDSPDRPTSDESRDVSVFFLGNSYTAAGGGQQRLVPELLKAGLGVGVRVGHRGCAGETLRGHLERNLGQWPRWRENRMFERQIPRFERAGKTDEEIAAMVEHERAVYRQDEGALDDAILDGSPWDYVVLQVGKGRFDAEKYDLADAVEELVTKFRTSSPESVIILYSTWVDQEEPERQPESDRVCLELARRHGLRMAPAGTAMHPAHAGRPSLDIFRTATDSHPGIHGAYLVACVLYATITDKSPVGLPSSFDMEASYDFGDPSEHDQQRFTIEEGDARYLQQQAWRVHLERATVGVG